jgi:hypothetical protein
MVQGALQDDAVAAVDPVERARSQHDRPAIGLQLIQSRDGAHGS